jgi:hypothetical protein
MGGMKATQILRFGTRNRRRNLPGAPARRRGESDFVRAFERAYLKRFCVGGVGGREFEMFNYGIADFVWIAWRGKSHPEEATALTAEKIQQRLQKHLLTAFELKLRDWRRGLSQAYRYRYFADRAIVVLPPQAGRRARGNVSMFRRLKVGVWSFDKTTGKIHPIFTPTRTKARNAAAKEKAIELITRRLDFSKFLESRNAISHRL